MEKDRKKELLAAYKERPEIGGIYIIHNLENGKMLLQSTPNLQGDKNQFDFAIKTGGLVHMKMQADWEKYGKEAFSLEVLDELKKKPEQTVKEFREDLKLLLEIWSMKLDSEKLY